MKPTVENVLSVYSQATVENVAEGMEWYNRANEFAITLDSDVKRACAVIAVLSPNASWKANKTLALKAYSNRSGEGMGLPDKISKINRLFAGENPDTVVSGPKVTRFYSSILSPDDANAIPTIDRHAFDIAVGMRTDDKSRGSLSRKGMYMAFADVYRAAATIIGIGSPQVQAITWVTWKEIHNIKV